MSLTPLTSTIVPLGRRYNGAVSGASSSLLTGLISYWKLDEASGTRNDIVGGNHLTDVNGVTAGAGKVSNAAQFATANSQRLFRASNASLQTGHIDFSLFLWFVITSAGAGTGRMIVAKSSEYFLQVGGTGVAVWVTAQADNNFGDFGSLSYDTWHSFYGEYDAANGFTRRQFDNGTTFSTAIGTPIAAGASAFELGSAFSGNQFLDGMVDEAGFWKRVLTVPERTQLYNSGDGTTYPFS